MTMQQPEERSTGEPASAASAVRKSPYAIPLAALLAGAHVPVTEQFAWQAEPPQDVPTEGDGGADGE
ncbi:MAG: hypothetical protein ACR2FQ_05020 [Pseudonocardiaceae bacterium]